MKSISLAAAGVVLFVCAGGLWADTPDIEPGVQIYDNTDPIDEGIDSCPTMVDWNNDGKKDLILGIYRKFDPVPYNILLYLNQGTDQDPVFNGWSYIESNGAPIVASYG